MAKMFYFVRKWRLKKSKLPFRRKIIGYLDTENPFDLYPKTFTTLLIESEHLTVKRQRELSQAFDVQVYSDLDQSIKDLRNIKSQEEIEKIKKGSELADKCIEIGVSILKKALRNAKSLITLKMKSKVRRK